MDRVKVGYSGILLVPEPATVVRDSEEKHVDVHALEEVQEVACAGSGVDVGCRRHHRLCLGKWSEMER